MTDTAQTSSINDKIWITSHVRMSTERKLLRYNNLSLMFLTYYSAFVVVISIFAEYYKNKYALFDNFNLSSSVIVLIVSLVVGGFRFEQTAAIYRECYLALDKLFGEDASADKKFDRYHEILSRFPNHSDRDYHDFLVQQVLIEGKKVWSGNINVKYTKYMMLSFLIRKSILYLSFTSLLLFPLLFLSLPFIVSIYNAGV